MKAAISGFLQQLRFELTRKQFNTAALQCELQLENQTQVAKSKAELSEGVLWWMGVQPR